MARSWTQSGTASKLVSTCSSQGSDGLNTIRPFNRVWVAFFVALRDKGLAGVFVNGFLTLWFGSVIVVFHNVWTGLPIVLTVIGWSQIIKAAVSFIAPRLAMRSMARVSIERAWEFQVAGVMLIGLSGVMAYLVALP